jgi:hypothetical protein
MDNIRQIAELVLVGVLLVSLVSNLRAQSAPSVPRRDTQIWNDLQIALPVSERVDLNLLGTLRLGQHVTRSVDERVGAGLTLRLDKYLTLAPNYLYLSTQPAPGRKSYEHRLTIPATVRFTIGKFTLSDRNQFERRIRHPQVDATRYRNRLQIEHPVKLGGLKLQLFVSEEVFYDWSVRDWVRNRFALGASRRFNRHFTLDLYYLRQNDGRTKPGDLYVLGAVYRIRL